MKIGYFCYHLSGTGPRTRAADIIEAVATESAHDVVVLTNEPDRAPDTAEVRHISLGDPLELLRTAKRCFADADVVHVPVNVYQVLFVRLVYWGPLVGGVGPGIQPTTFHRYLGRLLRIDKKIIVHETDKKWENTGYDTAICTATIDRQQFYPYDEERVRQLRAERGFDEDDTVVLYVGRLTEYKGAHVVDEMARLAVDEDDLHFIVAGAGPMEEIFRNRQDLVFEGFVDNDAMPDLYNVADVTVAPRESDKTSNVGLESIACGTPMVTTATGKIVRFFHDRGTYVWADRSPDAVLQTVRDLVSDPEYYERQRQRGFETMEEMELTLSSALETHLQVYDELAP